MLTTIVEIHHNGALLAAEEHSVEERHYWLPPDEWGYLSAPEWKNLEIDDTWEKARVRIEVGGELDVVPVLGRMHTRGLQVVSTRRVALRDLGNLSRPIPRDMRIMDISREFIKGRIGNVSVVLNRQEYTEFLERLGNNELLKDHAALAPGDFISVVALGPATPDMHSGSVGVPHLRVTEGWLRAGLTDAMDFVVPYAGRRFARVIHDLISDEAQTSHSIEESPRDKTPALPPGLTRLLSPLLYVENNAACRKSTLVALQSLGIDVIAAASLPEAERLVRERGSEFRAAVIDVYLFKEGGELPECHNGIELAQRLRTQFPGCLILLTSGADPSAVIREYGHISVHGYVSKPVLASNFAIELENALAPQALRPLRTWLRMEGAGTIQAQTFPSVTRLRNITLQQALEELYRAKSGMVVHVFRVRPRSWRGTSLGHLGDGLRWAPFREKLSKSIIKDAACQDEAVLDNQCSAEDGRHLWTREMMKYGSFWGKRLEAPGPYRYVLAAFHPDNNVFDELRSLKACICSERATRVITQAQLLRQGRHDAEYIAAGLGFGCLAHEIYDDITGVDGAATQIALHLGADGTPTEAALANAREWVELLVQTSPDLVQTAKILRGRVIGTVPVSVEYCLDKAAQIARRAFPEMSQDKDKNDILIDAPSPDCQTPCMTNAIPSAVVTVFYNVFLNAVQQIDAMRCVRNRGRIWATVERCIDEHEKPWAVVRIHDTGPGIHPEDWESIFEPGHSTKTDGTGLGLHICRLLLRDIRRGASSATIEVTRSAIWGGTTFAIRLPVSEQGEMGHVN